MYACKRLGSGEFRKGKKQEPKIKTTMALRRRAAGDGQSDAFVVQCVSRELLIHPPFQTALKLHT